MILCLLLGVVSISASGCLALAIPSLAYTGYQYKKGEGPFAPQHESSSSSSQKKSKSSGNRVPDSEIE